jgi:DNA-directed RNA polymerase subunit L
MSTEKATEQMSIDVVIHEDNGKELLFTLENADVSVANALRRTILSNIGTIVFRTTPHERNDCTIYKNTTKLNNEIIKQRLSCIPIHYLHNVPEDEVSDMILELNVENTSNEYRMVTTKDFKIKSKSTGKYLDEDTLRLVFPRSKTVYDTLHKEYFIDFVKLRPRISDIPGEHIHLTCEFSYGYAKEDGMFNVVSTCSYGFTKDQTRIPAELEKKRDELEHKGLSPEEIRFALKDWLLLDSFRITKPNSFDFIVESVGVYPNRKIVKDACLYLIDRFRHIDEICYVEQGSGIMENEYVIYVNEDDYTLGKVIEKMLYKEYFEGGETEDNKIMSFCGFRKAHPHDTFATVTVCYISKLKRSYEEVVMSHLHYISDQVIGILHTIMDKF